MARETAVKEPVVKTKASPSSPSGVAEVVVSFPIGDGEAVGYQRQLVEGGEVPFEGQRGFHLNLQIGKDAAMAFTRVRSGMIARGATLPNGRPVWSNADVLRCILEQIAASL